MTVVPGVARSASSSCVAVARRLPARGGLLAGLARDEHDAIGHHEARVEAHPELADQLGSHLPLLIAHRLEELARAGAGDGPDVLARRRLAAHADAVVPHGQRALRSASASRRISSSPSRLQLGPRDRLEAQLVQRVGGVGDELAQEDVLVGVERVDHEVQQLPDLGLELVPLGRGRAHGCAPLTDFLHSTTHQVGVHPEVIVGIGVAERHLDAAHVVLDLVHAREQRRALLGRRIVRQRLVHIHHVAVALDDLRAIPPPVDVRHQAPDRHQHEQGEDQHLHAVHQRRRPERQVARQERRPRLVIALRLVHEGKLQVVRRGKLLRGLEQTAAAVDGGGGDQDQVHQGRVEVVADDQRGRRGQHQRLLGRQVLLQAQRAGVQDELVEEGEMLGVGVGAGEAEQLDPRRVQHLLHGGRARPGDHEHRVDGAGPQRLDGLRSGRWQQTRGRLGDAVGGQQREGDRARAAALRADRPVAGRAARAGRSARERCARTPTAARSTGWPVTPGCRSSPTDAVPPCTKAMSTPLLGSSSRRMFSTEPEVSRTSSVTPALASRSRYC